MTQKTVTLHVAGMHCNGCRSTVERSLQKLEGVQEAAVTLNPAEARVTFDADSVTVEDLTNRVVAAGYSVADVVGA